MGRNVAIELGNPHLVYSRNHSMFGKLAEDSEYALTGHLRKLFAHGKPHIIYSWMCAITVHKGIHEKTLSGEAPAIIQADAPEINL